MNCPKCGKELELKNKQVGIDESGKPILNKYGICRDCKKQWNLEKQKAKKPEAPAMEKIPPIEKAPVRKAAPVKRNTSQKADVSSKTDAIKENGSAPKKRPSTQEVRPAKKKRPVSADAADSSSGETKQTYSNIPPEKVRVKKERAVRKNYEDMLATDPNRKQTPKRKRPASVSEAPAKRPASEAPKNKKQASASGKRPVPQPKKELPVEEEVTPKFQILRIIFGVVSLIMFAFFAYKGFMAGLNNISSGKSTLAGTIYIVLALCMLVSGLLLFILRNKDTILTFILPMLFYLGGAIFAFIKRTEDKFLLISAVIGLVLAIIFLVLTFASRGNHDEDDFDDDYDDPFEEDHDNY